MGKFLSIRHKTPINKSIKRSQQNPRFLVTACGGDLPCPTAFRANMSKFCSPSTVNRDVSKWVRNFRTGRKVISQPISEWILSFLSASSLSNTAVSSNLKKKIVCTLNLNQKMITSFQISNRVLTTPLVVTSAARIPGEKEMHDSARWSRQQWDYYDLCGHKQTQIKVVYQTKDRKYLF